MITGAELQTLDSKEDFRRRREEEWRKNSDYWLSSQLRHVIDVGDYICDRAESVCRPIKGRKPVLVDMGCGSAWLLKALLARQLPFVYYGLDSSETFIASGRKRFSATQDVHFDLADLEIPLNSSAEADLVVNAFNFFELCDLEQGFANARRLLRPGGKLLVSTIDKTYLILAISDGWEDFYRKLKDYSELKGIKYAFQPIDFGDKISDVLYYPSVLYSTQDYLDAAEQQGLQLQSYKEAVFTAKLVPKIYNHLEFIRVET